MPCLTFDSPFGPMHVISCDGTLTEVNWGVGTDTEPDDVSSEAARQIVEYFASKRRSFNLPLAPVGTPFRLRVWKALQVIPYGQTTSYGNLARLLETAPRAVGGACGANPLPIVIPCHRVVGVAGLSGGYSGLGGLATKAWLLDLEQRSL